MLAYVWHEIGPEHDDAEADRPAHAGLLRIRRYMSTTVNITLKITRLALMIRICNVQEIHCLNTEYTFGMKSAAVDAVDTNVRSLQSTSYMSKPSVT